MRKEQREQIKSDYIYIIICSWTYARLTRQEQEQIMELLKNYKPTENTKKDICEALNTIYRAYLVAKDYSPTGWRENNELLF